MVRQNACMRYAPAEAMDAMPGDADFTARISFSSEFRAVRNAMSDLIGRLRAAGLSPEDLSTIELVVAEALNNVVEHAYLERGDGRIDLSFGLCGAGFCASICDEGAPMPGLELPEGKLPEAETGIDQLPEGGFGWHLIRTLTEDLTYARVGSKNITRFVIPLGAPPTPPEFRPAC